MLNNNFSKLIKLYEKYQKQQRNKMLVQILFTVLALAIVYFIVARYLHNKKQAPVAQTTVTTEVQKSMINNTAVQTPQPEQHTVAAVPKTPVQTTKTETMPKQVTKRTPSHTKKRKEESFQLKVTQRESLYNMLVAYKDKKTYKTAIKIAQFYMLQKEYEKAVKWAVEASKKDPTQAQSWIIYAKAKRALGKPEVAKRALTIFLKHNYSQAAQDLLNSL